MTQHPFAPSRQRLPSRRTALRVSAALCVALLASGAAVAQSTQAAPSPAGRWISANGNVEVDITHCGAAWCGTITRVLGQQSMSRPGEVMTPVDTRPAVGMTILKDFVADEADTASGAPNGWHGQIYNRENGKTYRCLMSLDASGGLVLRPYVGLPLFGRTQVWRRADATATSAAGTTRQAAPKEAQP